VRLSRSAPPMKSAKQRRQSRVIGPSLPWQCCFTKPVRACLFFFCLCDYHIWPFWCRNASTAHTGAVVIRTFASHAGAGEGACRWGECMWSGALIYLVMLGWWRVLMRRLPDEPAPGARYCSACFLPELDRFVDDEDGCSYMRLNVGCYICATLLSISHMHSASEGTRCSCSCSCSAFLVLITCIGGRICSNTG
jgi:hypothetical protein